MGVKSYSGVFWFSVETFQKLLCILTACSRGKNVVNC